ncbi:phospholipase, patatin family protein, partial [Aureobasidium melanogenum]
MDDSIVQNRVNQYGGDPNPLDDIGLCILSLDGGGVRGLSTLYILKNIMDRLNEDRKGEQLKPCDVFDLIGGTSTGGLIAIMLGRLEMSVDKCIEAYIDLMKTVFGQKSSRIPFNWKGKVRAQFDSARLENAINSVIAKCGASKTDLLNDGAERGCRTFVCSIDYHTKRMVRLRSYRLPHEPKIDATICQAALATSAATTFFEPVNIGDRRFADGGFGANNPVDQVEGEASNIWCHETGDLKPLVKCFISIGTGNPGTEAFEDNLFRFLTQTVVGIATETEKTAESFNERWAEHYDSKRYFRFNVEQGLQRVGLEEYKRKGVIEAASYGYLTQTAQKFQVRDCIQNLKLKQNRTTTNFSKTMTVFNERCRTARRHLVPFSLKGVPFIDHFVQRDKDMQKLEDFFLSKTSHPAHRKTFVVHGLGGIGKTQLCVEFARKHQALYTAVLWMDGSSEGALKQSFDKVFRMLPDEEMPTALVGAVECGKASSEEIVQGVLNWLSLPSNQEWLHVIDNVDHDINTNPQDPLAYNLEKYSAQADHDIMKNELSDLQGLFRRLEGMPLALAQAGSFIHQTDITLREYLGFYDETWSRLIGEQDEYPLQEYAQRSMLTTWKISYQQVKRRNREAATLLELWAFLDPKDLWYELISYKLRFKSEIGITSSLSELLSTLGKDQLKFRSALGLLKKYSLVNKGTDDDNYSMHAVLHSWCRHQATLSSTSKAFPKLAVSLVAQMAEREGYKNHGVLLRRLFPHSRQLLKELRLDTIFKPVDVPFLAIDGLTRLLRDGSPSEEAVEILERIGEEKFKDPAYPFWEGTVFAMHAHGLAIFYLDLGKHAKAQQLAERALAIFEETLSSTPEHTEVYVPTVIYSLVCLGENYEDQNMLEDAEAMYKRAIAVSVQHQQQHTKFGNALDAMSILGSVYVKQNRLTEAETRFKQAVELSSEVYGPQHHSTLLFLSKLFEVYYKLSKVMEARALVEQAAAELDKKMLEDHRPGDDVARAELLQCVQLVERDGGLTEALDLTVGILEMNEQFMTEEHRVILDAASRLASLYDQDNSLLEARCLYERLVRKVFQISEIRFRAEEVFGNWDDIKSAMLASV